MQIEKSYGDSIKYSNPKGSKNTLSDIWKSSFEDPTSDKNIRKFNHLMHEGVSVLGIPAKKNKDGSILTTGEDSSKILQYIREHWDEE